ncbi:MAG: hypothetical protein AAGG48_00620 [Planctomycetota bacterium]
MKKRTTTFVVLLSVLFVASVQGDPHTDMQPPKVEGAGPGKKVVEEKKPPKVDPLMQLKLETSKKILEGLALEDYDMIAKNARSLKLLSLEAGWNVIQTEEYATQSRDFRRSCDLIEKAAKEKEIGRAALGYVALTVRCVECHSYMRQHRVDIAQRLRLDEIQSK